MIRLILNAIVVILYVISSIILMPLTWIISKINPVAGEKTILAIMKSLFNSMMFLSGIKLTVIGEENVPKDKPVLYIGNHKSNFDTIITYARVPGRCGYIAKDNLEKIPVLRGWMKRIHCLFLNRENTREGLKTILTAIDYIKDGVSMTIFPEGGRNKTDEPTLPFHEGSFKLSTKTGCPIIPMAISNSEHILETHMPFIRATHVVLQYGKPIIPDELAPEDKKFIGAYTQKVVEQMLEDNQNYL